MFVAAVTGTAQQAAETNKVALAADTYRLQPQDKLYYRIAEDPVKGNEPDVRSVTALNEILFPISRGSDQFIRISTLGRTLEEVRKELKQKLDADYYYNATVELTLINQSQKTGKATFSGRVVKGQVSLLPGEQKTLSEAIVSLGYNEFANLKKVKLYRVDPNAPGQKAEPKIYDVEAALKGDRSKDVVLQDGDNVEVPEKGVIFQ